jgi:hypothetical protein
MEKCEFCEAQLPADASFCGNCGNVPHKTSHQATRISNVSKPQISEIDAQATIRDFGTIPDENEATLLTDLATLQLKHADAPLATIQNAGIDENEATLIIGSGASTPWESLPTALLPSVDSSPPDEKKNEEDEEEKRRRAALLGFGVPLLGALADAPPGHILSTPGTPQIAQMASLQGTPQIGQPGMVHGQALGPSAPALPGSGAPTAAPFSPGPGSSPPLSLPGGPGPSPAPGSPG